MEHRFKSGWERLRVVSRNFFHCPTLTIAPELLGKFLVVRKNGAIIRRMIMDVEAYAGPNDRASHASRGKTERNKIMFEKGGMWYVYFTYGMHWMLNAVTEEKDYPAAILIRGVEGISGPGRLTKFFGIDQQFNGKAIAQKTGLWIEDHGIKIRPRAIARGRRIGVDYSGAWKEKLWRFYISGSSS